jgi:tetratricopeptide (TPR) repeat protein
MEFGRPKARKADTIAPKLYPSPGTWGRIALLAFIGTAFSAALLVSCGVLEKHRVVIFSNSLATLDSALASYTGKGADARGPTRLNSAFAHSYRWAMRDSEWLSLLKRARVAQAEGETGRYASTADRAVKAFPKSEPLLAAAVHAYLRSGDPQKALNLFGPAMSPEARPYLWAEAFISSNRTGTTTKTLPADYDRLAGITGDPRAYLGAATMSLASGDKVAGAAWLAKGLAAGVVASPDLLWDCGLYDRLASMSDSASGSAELAILGDAAWKTGDIELAKSRWIRSLALAPVRSWKPYADLALISSDSEAAGSYWARMKAAFLSAAPSAEREGALAAFAAQLARQGRNREALALLKGEGPAKTLSGKLAVLDVTIRGRSMPEARFASELENLAARRPEDTEVIEAVFRALSRRGMYGEVAVLEAGASRRGLRFRNDWYYEAEILTARGDYSGAAAEIRGNAGAMAEPEGEYALGSLYAATGDAVKSAEAYSKAATLARRPAARCASLKAYGRELGATGDERGEVAAYRAALAADPLDHEAALLVRGAAAR